MIIERRQFLAGLAGIIAAPTIIVRGIIRSTAPALIVPDFKIDIQSRYYVCVVAGVGGSPGPFGRSTWMPVPAQALPDQRVIEADVRQLDAATAYRVGDVVKINRTNGFTSRLRKPEIET